MAWLRDVIEYDSDQVVNKIFFIIFISVMHSHTITQNTGLYSITHIRIQTQSMETTSAQTYILSPISLLGVMFLLPVTRTLPINDVQIPLQVCVFLRK